MKCGIHVGYNGQLRDYMKFYTLILDKNKIPYKTLDVNNSDFWDHARSLDLFIYRWAQYDQERQIARTIIPILHDELGVLCFPDSKTSWLFDDKIRQQALFTSAGFPMVDGRVFYEIHKAMDWLSKAPLPIVFKLRKGAASENVVLIRDRNSAESLIKRMFGYGVSTKGLPIKGNLAWKNFRSIAKNFVKTTENFFQKLIPAHMSLAINWEREKNYVYFQKYLPNNDFDTRVTVIGDRAFAFRRWVRSGDFRASGSGLIDYDISGVDLDFIEMAFKISKHFGYKSMAYDFLYDEKRNVALCEASYTFVDRAVYNCPGYWNSSLEYREGHMWPAYCQLTDLFEISDLKTLDENLE